MNAVSMTVVLLALIVVGLPVVLGIAGDVYKRRLRFMEKKMELMAGAANERAARAASRAVDLEQRVRVLEQIITDQGLQTAAQIEALRDRPTLATKEIDA